ncbi:MAG: hypothetical protein WA940_00340 [Sphingopyxis sp.]
MGRPKKKGARTKSGQLSRSIHATYDHGTERARDRKAAFKGNGYDPAGRAYEKGLFGKGVDGKPTAEAKILLDMARSLNRAYWCEYEVGREGCTLGKHGASSVHFGPPIRGLDDPEQERWLVRQLDKIHWSERRVFDQLVLDHFPDDGPVWLDRLLTGEGRESDDLRMALVIACLRRLCVDRL